MVVAAAPGSRMAELKQMVGGEKLVGERDFDDICLRHIDKISIHSAFSNSSDQK